MKALTREEATEVERARLRIAQVALVGAMDVNRSLLTNEAWGDALALVNRLIQEATPADDANQLVLFPQQRRAAR